MLSKFGILDIVQNWLAGYILDYTGSLSLNIELEDGGRIWRRHIDQVRKQHHVEPNSGSVVPPDVVSKENESTEISQDSNDNNVSADIHSPNV